VALLVESKIYYESLPADIKEMYSATGFCIEVSKKFLSDYYSLWTGCRIMGKILEVVDPSARIEELRGASVHFVLIVPPLGSIDRLHFSEECWKEVRDYGLIPDETEIKVELIEAEMDGDVVSLFPKRDVVDVHR